MIKFNNIDSAIEYITNRRNINQGIEHFREVMNNLGNPQNDFSVIHVAGTNGKGSTVNFIKDILLYNGYKVGTFTSPHLIKHQDRIRINDEFISDEDFLYYINKYYELIESEILNMFEIDTLIMSLYFKENNIDFGVVETGIGGRLDSTNIFEKPLVSVITTIGYDHTDRLGNTLDKIAIEKAEIIKPNSKAVVGYLKDLAMKAVFDKCEDVNAHLYLVRPYRILDAHLFSYEKENYEINNDAQYLMENACTALETIDSLDLNLDINLTKKAIKESSWPGRFERIKDNIIIDGAHNFEGVEALINAMKNCKKPHVIVFSALKDKPVFMMLKKLKENSDTLIISEFNSDRVIDPRSIAGNLDVLIIENYQDAISEGIIRSAGGTLFICGSLYFVSEVRKYLLNH